MPSIYEYHHVELDKVGKGKRVLKPPGGACSDIFGPQSPSSDGSGSTTPTGRRSSDFGCNTKDRLFGGSPLNVSIEDVNGSPARRASIDRMKSNIFDNVGDQVDTPKPNSAKKYGKVTPRRNPITGEIEAVKEEKTNGHHTNGNGHLNGHSVEDKSPVQQNNNVRVRKPPGGESSGIF